MKTIYGKANSNVAVGGVSQGGRINEKEIKKSDEIIFRAIGPTQNRELK